MQTPNPKPQTPNSKLQTPNPKPQTLSNSPHTQSSCAALTLVILYRAMLSRSRSLPDRCTAASSSKVRAPISPNPMPLRIFLLPQCSIHTKGTIKLTAPTRFTAEDNMNVQLKDITVTARDGRVSHLDQVYIRGSHVRFFIVPDMLRFVSPHLSLS